MLLYNRTVCLERYLNNVNAGINQYMMAICAEQPTYEKLQAKDTNF